MATVKVSRNERTQMMGVQNPAQESKVSLGGGELGHSN